MEASLGYIKSLGLKETKTQTPICLSPLLPAPIYEREITWSEDTQIISCLIKEKEKHVEK